MHSPLLKKIGWFVALWIMSVIALGIVAYVIRLAIIP
ncbi:MAG: DUF2474 domain-containing protein [Yoonia sp.]